MAIRCERVCVIGGGFSGIFCIKELLDEGIQPVCYEKSPDIGGTWCYRDKPIDGLPSTMSTTSINHSKEMGSVSNILYPDDAPNYLRHWEIYSYLTKMGETLGLFKYITCNREVTSVRRASDYEETGKWEVSVKNMENGEITSEIFDGVMVCTGHITYPKMPEYPGMNTFQGTMMHSHDLKTYEMFRDLKVAVIGTGCSALDAAVAISSVARQVYLSIRTPSWILSRVGPYGVPIDYALLRRHFDFFQSILPIEWCSRYTEKTVLDPKFSHELYDMKPKYPLLSKDPSVNDDIASRILNGSVKIRKEVKCFKENGIIFKDDGDEITELDAVIFATGYTWQFSFLEEGIIDAEGDRIDLYKCMYPPKLKHSSLVIIGFLLPFGPGFPLGELQCRWAAHIFSGKGTLPSKEIMMKDIEERYRKNKKRYAPCDKMSIRVDFIQYMDEIATELGVKPNFWKMLFTDPVLFKACVFGPCVPYQYRLTGPHKWDGARRAILTAPQRMRAPLQKYNKVNRKTDFRRTILAYTISICVAAFLLATHETTPLRYLFLVLLIPYYISARKFSTKYFLGMLLLPFYVTWNGFSSDYFVTIFAPLALAAIASIL